MNRIATLLIIFLLVFSQTSLAQDRIEGFGSFKLRKSTVSIIDSIAKEKKLKIMQTSSFQEVFSSRRRDDVILELVSDTVKTYLSPSYSHLCPNVRVFQFPSLTISGIDFENFILTFYNDTLVEIHSDWSKEITEAIEIKYGKTEIERKTEKTTCTLKLTGTEVSYEDDMFYQRWHNGPITCTVAIGSYRNSKCEKSSLAYIVMNLSGMSEEIRKCDTRERERLQTAQREEKKKQLDGF